MERITHLRNFVVIMAVLLTSLAFGLVSIPTSAQQWVPPEKLHDLYDADDIACTNAFDPQKDEEQYKACREGYKNHDKSDFCDTTYKGKEADACKAGGDRHGDPGVKFCAARYSVDAPDDPQNAKFYACFDGFKNGEGACSTKYPESDPSKKPLRDACLEGTKGGLYNRGAEAAADAPESLETKEVLGKAPNHADIRELVAGKNEVSKREKCSIEGFFGSLLCGFMDMMSNMADASLALLGSFMKVDMLTTNQDDPIYEYWKVFNGIANTLFIIALLAVVLSQISGMGISAYNVQKMLPRLVVGAVLLNMSFYLCAAAVDVSNILGSTVYGTMKDAIAPDLPPDANERSEDRLQTDMRTTTLTNPKDGTEITWGLITNLMTSAAPPAAVGAGAMIMNGGFVALIPIVVSVALSIMIVVVSLLLRQALIIVFIIISPLAFAAYLLPNTKSLFDRWLKSFIPLLMLFPVIAFVFGIGSVVSEILVAAAFAKPNFVVRSLFVLIALAVQILPLLYTPRLMALGGGLLAELSNAARSKAGSVNGRAKEYAEKQKKLGDRAATANPHWWNKHRRMRAEHEAKNANADAVLEAAQERQTKAHKIAEAGPQETPGSTPAPTEGIPDGSDTATSGDSDGSSAAPTDPASTGTSAPSRPDSDDPADATDPAADVDPSSSSSADTDPIGSGGSGVSDSPEDTDDYDSETAKEIHIAVAGKTSRVEARSAQFNTEHAQRDDILAIALLRDKDATNTDIEGAIMNLASVGDVGAILEMIKVSDQMTSSQRQTLVKSIKASGVGSKGAPMLKDQEVLDNIQKGNVNASNIGSRVIAPSLRNNDYSPETMASLDQDMARELLHSLKNAQANGISREQANDVISATNTALTTSSTNRRISKQRSHLEGIQKLGGRT